MRAAEKGPLVHEAFLLSLIFLSSFHLTSRLMPLTMCPVYSTITHTGSHTYLYNITTFSAAATLLGLFDTEDEDSVFLRNVGHYLAVDTP